MLLMCKYLYLGRLNGTQMWIQTDCASVYFLKRRSEVKIVLLN